MHSPAYQTNYAYVIMVTHSLFSYGSTTDTSPRAPTPRTLVATTNSGKQKNTHINVFAHHGTMQTKTAIVLLFHV